MSFDLLSRGFPGRLVVPDPGVLRANYLGLCLHRLLYRHRGTRVRLLVGHLIFVVKLVASLLESLVDVVGEVVEEMSGHRRVQRVGERHANVVDDLALVRAERADLPVRVQPLEDPAVLRLGQYPVRALEAHVRNVGERELRETDLDLAIEFPPRGLQLLRAREKLALGDPGDEFIVVLNVFDNVEEVLLRVGQDLASGKLDGRLLEGAEEASPGKGREKGLYLGQHYNYNDLM
jgi:hypothetical protein